MTELKDRLKIITYTTQKLLTSTKHQVGTTAIQKIIFLLNREGITDYTYKMYHYGPYSNQVSQDVTFAGESKLLKIDWIEDKGYDIKIDSTELLSGVELTKSTTDAIDRIVTKFGKFNAVELSLIATAYFVLDNTDVGSNDKQLVAIVTALKPNYSDRVESVLKRAGIIPIPKTN
ncbi:type II toxin-antitoxin system antitoxin SocA domain-containing protein [Methanoregula sp.]|uniref:type II toxin-antitoxin system antitoxin SocA domain-containing protein n=1 Tax=Methanoregula sp. TaxID=2052170 RepID=UPI003BAE9C07